MQNQIKTLINSLTANKEDQFCFFDLTEGYDVTINEIESGASITLHRHEQDVFNNIFEGEFEVFTHHETQVLKKGEWIYIPANEEHSVTARTKTVLLELWKKPGK